MDLKLLRHNVRLVLVLQLHKTGQGWTSFIERDQLKRPLYMEAVHLTRFNRMHFAI
jgi:hypothetical protein